MNKVRHSYDGGGVQITFGIIYIMRFISVASVMVTVTEIGINQQSSNSSRVCCIHVGINAFRKNMNPSLMPAVS